ncbi:MAG: DoxX family protein [Flavobacteriales bacterium]|nr:DoxX family protein [Flavobacteriales bacterium]
MLFKSDEINIDLGILVVRASAGGMMLWQHGWPKLMNFTDRMDNFADPIGLGSTISLALITLAETLCALLVALGLWTRFTTLPLIIGMAVIAFVVKGGDGFGEKELALVYLAAFLGVFLTGSGRFSLDRLTFQ